MKRRKGAAANATDDLMFRQQRTLRKGERTDWSELDKLKRGEYVKKWKSRLSPPMPLHNNYEGKCIALRTKVDAS